MAKDWYRFQEEIKKLFLDLGCDAQANIKMKGVRTSHDIDVLVRSKYLGQPIQWIIEAKHWNKKVSKLHVLALRTIVEDTGTDKGFIISQKGFQSGAFEAAETSNIQLLTLEELIQLTKDVFHKDILKTYARRLNYIVNRYYSHDKKIRIKYALRHEMYDYDVNFSVYYILMASARVIGMALENRYPIDLETYQDEKFGELTATNFYQAINWLNLNLIIAEERILEAEVNMQKNNEFSPKLFHMELEVNPHMKIFESFARRPLSG